MRHTEEKMVLSRHEDEKLSFLTVCGICFLTFFLMFRYLVGGMAPFLLIAIAMLLAIRPVLRFRLELSDYLWLVYALAVLGLGLLRDDKSVTLNRFMILLLQLFIKWILQTNWQGWRSPFCRILFAMGCLHAAAVVMELFNPDFIRGINDLLRVESIRFSMVYRKGITNQPAVAGFCISIFVCIAMTAFLKTTKKTKVFFTFTTVFGLAALLLTGKRALFAEVLGCCFLAAYLYYAVIQHKGFKMFTAGLVIIAALPFIAQLPVFQLNVDRLLHGDDAGRYVIYNVLINNFKSSPLVGVGRDVFREQMDIGAHNEYLRVLSENGLFGFVFFLPALLVPLLKILGVIVLKRVVLLQMLATEQRDEVFALLMSVFWQITILLYSMTGNPLNTIDQTTSYFVFVAIGTGAVRKLIPFMDEGRALKAARPLRQEE